VLVCARCDARWTTTARGCLGCGAVKAETLARLPSTHTGYTVIVCSACGRYLKERDADPAGTVDLLVERALTEELDRAAERRALRL
jgi:formate dehydrogenase maturation protein FdhE